MLSKPREAWHSSTGQSLSAVGGACCCCATMYGCSLVPDSTVHRRGGQARHIDIQKKPTAPLRALQRTTPTTNMATCGVGGAHSGTQLQGRARTERQTTCHTQHGCPQRKRADGERHSPQKNSQTTIPSHQGAAAGQGTVAPGAQQTYRGLTALYGGRKPTSTHNTGIEHLQGDEGKPRSRHWGAT